MRLATPLFVLLAAFQAGCDLCEVFAGSERFREDFQYSHALRSGGTVSLENFNGPVEILGWEKDEVQITGTKFAASQEDLRDLRIETSATGDSVRIRTVAPEGRRRHMGAKYVLRVPRQVELERVATSNGSIRVEDIRGSAAVSSSNGSLTLKRIGGRLTGGTSNASIAADGIDGQAVLHTSNATIRVEEMSGTLDATTSNASVYARLRKVAPRQPLKLTTSNGSIELRMDEFADNEIRASTKNASITLRLPDSAAARVRASTSNGSIQTDFESLAAAIRKNQLDGQLGSGGPLLHLSTTNGAIRVLRI